MKILVTEMMWPDGLEELGASGEVGYDPDLWRKPEDVLAKAREADAVIVRDQTRVDAPLLESGRLLEHDRVILTPHVAGLTEEAQINNSVLVAREVLRGQPSLCVVG